MEEPQPAGGEDHQATPAEGTCYTAVGSLPARLCCPGDYPVDALCAVCHQPVRAGRFRDPFRHTGRKPGDPR